MHRDEFSALVASEGFDEAVTVTREPNGTMQTHAHPFEAKALILDGELTIRVGDEARLYRVGDIFHLAANLDHDERYGPQGVTYLVGRK